MTTITSSQVKQISDGRAEVTKADASPVLLLHASGASHAQWQSFISSQSQTRQCLAPDLIGYGSTQDASDQPFSIDREVALIETAVSELTEPFHVVGHSYGGCAALRFVQNNPSSVRSLTLIEPVLFNLLKSDRYQAEWEEVSKLAEQHQAFVNAENFEEAGEHFIDYWCGAGFWQSMPFEFREHLKKLMPKVALELQQIWVEPNFVDELKSLAVPTCLIQGAMTRRPTAAIIKILSKTLRNSELNTVEGAGHMCPITHGPAVNDLISAFLTSTERGQTHAEKFSAENALHLTVKQFQANGA